jgi:glucose/arabinose dehydrogenase
MVRMMERDRGAWLRGLSVALFLSGAVFATACDDDDEPGDGGDMNDGGDAPDDGGSTVCDEGNGSITLPDGFCATVFADNLGLARHMAVTPSGDVFVAINNSRDGALGEVIALRDEDGDGRSDVMEAFSDAGGNGIAWRDGQLYFAQDDQVLRYDMPDGELLPTADPEVVVSGLPANADHLSKSIAISDAGELMVNIGSASNSCQVQNRAQESLGRDPCPELDIRAGVWSFDADGVDQIQEDGVRFGEGLRNMVALAFHPVTGALFGVQNGRDQLYDSWPDVFAPEDEIDLPSEEVFLIDGGDTPYGWPYCYHDPFLDQKLLAPEYGGDGVTVGECADVVQPDYAFPAHWAPLGNMFYTGEMFPERYQDGMFVAFHGSRFEPNATGDLPGYNVVFLPFDGDLPAQGDFEVFADDFAGDARPLPDEAEHRPVAMAQGPDGEMYISDDHGGRIWRVVYTGE